MLLQGWKRIANAVNADATISNRVFYDVLNEPDAFGVRFEPQNGRPGMKDLYFTAFDAIYSINPGACFLCQLCFFLTFVACRSVLMEYADAQPERRACISGGSVHSNFAAFLFSANFDQRS